MRKIIFLSFILALGLAVKAQNFQQIRDGVEYAQFTRQIKPTEKETAQTVVNALRLDLTKVRLDVVHAKDAAIGVETTSSMAVRYGAIAAINGGFFRADESIFNGSSLGLLQINGKILNNDYYRSVCLGILNSKSKTQIGITNLFFSGYAKYENKIKLEITSFNRQHREEDDLIVYTPEFNQSTLAELASLEVIVRNDKILEIRDGVGDSQIPKDGYVISAYGKYRDELKKARIGGKITLASRFYPTRDNSRIKDILTGFPVLIGTRKDTRRLKVEDIVSGYPQLTLDGKIQIIWEANQEDQALVIKHHPRTAVAKLKDGKFLMVTVDGGSEASGGMSLPELAEMMLEMGAVDAMNLNGDNSATMFLEGKVVNKPSDRQGERQVSDAILVTLRK